MAALSDVKLRQWVKAREPIAKADGGGLTFTLSGKGTAAWILRYRFGGKPRELTMGRYPDVSLAKARELAAEYRVEIQRGKDVAREKQKARADLVGAEGFKALAEDYITKVLPTLAQNTTAAQRRRHIRKDILPRLGSLRAREVTTGDVVTLLEAVGKRSHSVADLVLTTVSEIFKHGLARHVVTGNPCVGISVSAICGPAVAKRQRLKLTEAELRAVLPALPLIGTHHALAAKILLVTCARIGELAQAEWSRVNFDRAEWRIPAAHIKGADEGGRDFVVPLPPAVVDWFHELRTLACGSRYVLPAHQSSRAARHGGAAHFSPHALNAALHRLCDKLEGRTRRFTPHDLRSTGRSHLSALGVSLIVAERCLNHSLGGLVATYDQHDYLTERRAALGRLAEFVAACEQGRGWQPANNVAPMRPVAA